MKKVFIILFAVVSILSSCQKESDPVFDKSPDVRLNAKLKEYSDLLVGAKNGWKAEYYPDSSQYGGWDFVINFKEDGVVTMLSDMNTTPDQAPFESHYKVGAFQKPVLIFDSYTYLHQLADPANGVTGKGYKGDFQFEVVSVDKDVIILKGHFDKSILKLVKATAEDANFNARSKTQEEVNAYFSNPNAPYFNTLAYGTSVVDIQYNSLDRTITFKYEDAGKIVSKTSGFVFKDNGIELIYPVTLPESDKPIKNIPIADNGAGALSIAIGSAAIPGTISASHAPKIPYLNGVQDFYSYSFMTVYNVSPSLKSAFALITKADFPGYKGVQIYFSSDLNIFAVYCNVTVNGATKGKWYAYYLEWTVGPDGSLRASFLGANKAEMALVSKVAPFLLKIIDKDGFTVLDDAPEAYGSQTLHLITLVSRKNSLDRITLYKLE